MPHGRRSDRINRRDLESLAFVARFGVVPRRVLAARTRSGRTVSLERERRLRLAGLLEVRRAIDDHERHLFATRQGLRSCGHADLQVARPSPATVAHEATAAGLGARLELEGERILSEREILARERAEGARVFSAALAGGRFHRPDLIRLVPEGAEAIEVELTAKGAARLDVILRAWRFAVAEGRLTGVVYHCMPRTRPLVEKAIARTATGAMIKVVDLDI